MFISKSIVDLHGGTISVYSEGEGRGCTFLFKIPMQRKKIVDDVPSSVHHTSSLVPGLHLVDLPVHSPKLDLSRGSFVRHRDAQRLAQQRERLARSLSLSVHGIVNDDAVHRLSHSAIQQKQQQRSIHLENINNEFRSNVCSGRLVPSNPTSFRKDNMVTMNVANDQLVVSHDIVPRQTVVPVIVTTQNHALVPNCVSVAGVDTGGHNVGGGPGPIVSTQVMKRDGDDDGKVHDDLEALDAVKNNDEIRPTSSLIQSPNPNILPSNTVQPTKVASNKAIPIVTEEDEHLRSPTNTMIAVAPPTSRRQTLTSYAGRSTHTHTHITHYSRAIFSHVHHIFSLPLPLPLFPCRRYNSLYCRDDSHYHIQFRSSLSCLGGR